MDVEAVVAGVCPWAAQRAGAQSPQLLVAQAAVAEDAQQRVVALAGLAAPVGDAQEVCVLDVGERLGRADAVRGRAHLARYRVEAQLGGQGAQHGQMHTPGGECHRPTAAPAVALERPRVAGDRVGGQVSHLGRAAELLEHRVAEAAIDRPVLAPRRRPGRARGDQLADAVEVGPEQLLPHAECGRYGALGGTRERGRRVFVCAAFSEGGHLG